MIDVNAEVKTLTKMYKAGDRRKFIRELARTSTEALLKFQSLTPERIHFRVALEAELKKRVVFKMAEMNLNSPVTMNDDDSLTEILGEETIVKPISEKQVKSIKSKVADAIANGTETIPIERHPDSKPVKNKSAAKRKAKSTTKK